MTNYFGIINRVFQRETRPPVPHLTRAQARRLIFGAIDTLLKKEGFTYKKGNNVWRITDVKTDVIELQFLRLEDRQGLFELPESMFSISYGCYYPFIPDVNGERFLHRIDHLLTPREVDCHVRLRATRTIKQKLIRNSLLFSRCELLLLPYGKSKMHPETWHLDEPKERQALVLSDVLNRLTTEIIPTLNKLSDIGNWIELLETKESNLGVSSSHISIDRNFLLGFTYKHLGNTNKAIAYFMQAKKLGEELQIKFTEAQLVSTDLSARIQIINDAVAELT